MSSEKDAERFARALGEALIARWSVLPQELQQELFEDAVVLATRPSATRAYGRSLPAFCMTTTRARPRGPRRAIPPISGNPRSVRRPPE
jgi:hypothetical protein